MDGIAPINGPKNGMMLVTPTTTLIRIAIGSLSADIAMKHKMPIIIESIILPLINPPKVSLQILPNVNIFSAFCGLHTARTSFLPCAENASLLFRI